MGNTGAIKRARGPLVNEPTLCQLDTVDPRSRHHPKTKQETRTLNATSMQTLRAVGNQIKHSILELVCPELAM